MRRKDKEIQDRALIERLLAEAQVLHLGLCREGEPYVVPVSFGHDGQFLYFHTAAEGKKLDFMAANPRLCFELEHEVWVLQHDKACNWGMSFYSIIGMGRVEEIVEPEGKAQALNAIMRHYSGREWEFNGGTMGTTRVWRIVVEELSAKRSKDKAGGS